MEIIKKQTGFTLLETIIYFGLFSFILATSMSVNYQFLAFAQKNSVAVQTNEALDFARAKIAWYVNSSSSIDYSQESRTLIFNIQNKQLLFEYDEKKQNFMAANLHEKIPLLPATIKVEKSDFELTKNSLKLAFKAETGGDAKQVEWIFPILTNE